MLDGDFDDLITSDVAWWWGFHLRLQDLEANARGQAAAWPADDFVARRRYVACPRRGTHTSLTACWACWCDVTWGYATASEVLAPGDVTGVTVAE